MYNGNICPRVICFTCNGSLLTKCSLSYRYNTDKYLTQQSLSITEINYPITYQNTSMYFVAYTLKYLSHLPKRKKCFVEDSDVKPKFLSEVSDVKLQ